MTRNRGMLVLGVVLGLLVGSAAVEPATRELVNTDSPQTLSNKTLVSPVLQGNVGIGTTGPVSRLHVGGLTSGDAGITFSTQNLVMNNPGDSIRINFDSDLVNLGTVASIRAVTEAGGGNVGLALYTLGGNALAEALRIDRVGRVGIGTTSPASRLDLGGGCMTGSMCSDARLKEDIRPLPEKVSYLEKVLRLRGVSFQWKDRPQMGRQVGLIAQEVEMVLPEAVTTPEGDTAQKGLSCTALEAALVEAMKEQQAQIRVLQQEIAAVTRGHALSVKAQTD